MWESVASAAAGSLVSNVINKAFGGSPKVSYNSDPRWGTSAAATDAAYYDEAFSKNLFTDEGKAQFHGVKGQMGGGRAGKIGKWSAQTEDAYNKEFDAGLAGRKAGKFQKGQLNAMDWDAAGAASAEMTNAQARDTNWKTLGRGAGEQSGSQVNAFNKTVNFERQGRNRRDELAAMFPELNPYELSSLAGGSGGSGVASGGVSVPAMQKQAQVAEQADRQTRLDAQQSRVADMRYKAAELGTQMSIAKMNNETQLRTAAISAGASLGSAAMSSQAARYGADQSSDASRYGSDQSSEATVQAANISAEAQRDVAQLYTDTSRLNTSDTNKAQILMTGMNNNTSLANTELQQHTQWFQTMINERSSVGALTWNYLSGDLSGPKYAKMMTALVGSQKAGEALKAVFGLRSALRPGRPPAPTGGHPLGPPPGSTGLSPARSGNLFE